MSVIWNGFELIVNLFQGVALMYFPYVYLGGKDNRSFIKSFGLLYGLGLFALITIMNYLAVLENYILYIVLIFIYSFTQLNKSVLRKIFISIFSVLIALFSSAFVSNFMAVILGKELEDIFSINNIDRCVTIICVQLMILLCMVLSVSLLRKFDGDKNELGKGEWLLIAVVLTISCMICLFLNTLSLETSSDIGKRYVVFSVAGIILVNVVVCFLVVNLGKKNKALRENELLKLEQLYNRQLIDNANAEFENIRKLRHDFKNSYSVIYTLLTDNKTDEAKEFINQSLEQYTYTDIFINTNNEIVNAVINSKFSRAKALDIDVTCISISDFGGIDDMDLARLLMNLIDNSVAACSKVDGKPKRIVLKISSDEYKYDIFIKNTIGHSVLQTNPQLLTTKKNLSEHGYGTKIIKDISDKYNGRYDFYEEQDCFCCNVILKK